MADSELTMKLLIMTGPLYPLPGNNANLIGKLIPRFLEAHHEVHLFSAAFNQSKDKLPTERFGVPVHWVTDKKQDWKRNLLYPAVSRVIDPDGFSDAIQMQLIQRELKSVCRNNAFDAVISTSEPFVMACCASQLYGGKKLLYIMDPPESVCERKGTAFRNRMLPKILKNQSALITTPFILNALKEHALPLPERTEAVGFPMIVPNSSASGRRPDGKIRMLFCGWLYSGIRSPKYFLDIVSRLDERFEVTFMGKECTLLQKRFPTQTKAELITFPNQPYDVALQAMADADLLINIGNSVPVHMPSKTLEYINTGKPMVNFYKFADCPTLYYTKRYPLALNLFEEEKDMDAAAAKFIRFCEESIGKTVDRAYIEQEYADCTPEYIANAILKALAR